MSHTALEKHQTRPSTQVPVTSMRWPFEAFRRELDQLFGRFAGGDWPSQSLFGREFSMLAETGNFAGPAVDLAEREKEYEITAELPGLDSKNIEVKVSDSRLTITGEKQDRKEEKGKDRYLSERRYGAFMRTFTLPQDVDASKIEAQYANGILTVKLPKSADALKKEKTIEIKAA